MLTKQVYGKIQLKKIFNNINFPLTGILQEFKVIICRSILIRKAKRKPQIVKEI